MAEIDSPADLANVYESAGASAISVLTEQRRFLGKPIDLQQVRETVSLPLLRKDFIANEYQIFEARAWGANVVLLIAAWLSPSRLRELKSLVEQLGMTAFIEAHNQREVDAAVEAGGRLIGINARDLATFETDRDLYAQLAASIPSGVTKVAESAVRNLADVRAYRDAGADAVLVGEALVTGDAQSLIRSFVAI
jgi:indole-3-glycerol phosphate synthase